MLSFHICISSITIFVLCSPVESLDWAVALTDEPDG